MSVTALHGREAELQILRDVFDDAASGRLRVAVVEGEAGIGKTRLLHESLKGGPARQFQTLIGRVEELERNRSFGSLIEAFGCWRTASDPRRSHIARLIGTGPYDDGAVPTPDPGLQFRVVDAFVELSEEEALGGPVIVGLEDLHWADASTLVALRSLVRRLTDVPLAVVLTLRPAPRAPDLEVLLGALAAEGATEIHLGGLPEEAVVSLVTETLGTGPAPRLLAQLGGAGGNPLFLTELLHALEAETAITRTDGGADVAEVRLPPSFRQTILRRTGFLPPECKEALRSASLLGASFSIAELATVRGCTQSSILPALEPALDAGILQDGGQRLRFRHDLTRDAIYYEIPPSIRAALHRDAGRRLAIAGAATVTVAEHFARGAEPGDTEAVEWLARAARETAPRSPATAADFLCRALQLTESTDPARDHLLAERAVSLLWSGQVAESDATCREVLSRHHDPALDGLLRLLLVQAALAQGRTEDALLEVEAAAASGALSAVDLARIQAWGAHAHMLVGDRTGALAMAKTTLGVAEQLDEKATGAIAAACVAMCNQFGGRFAEAVTAASAAVELGDRSPGREGHRFHPGVFEGVARMDLDEVAAGIGALQRGRRVSEEIGARWNLPLYQISVAVGYYLSGQWDDAIAEFEGSHALAEECGTRHGMVWNYAVRALIALHRGNLGEAEEMVACAEQELAAKGPQYRFYWAMWARALLLEATFAGDAYAVLGGAWNLCEKAGFAGEYPLLGPDFVRMALAVGDTARAREVAAAVESVAAGNQGVPWVTSAALRCRGLVTGDVDLLVRSAEASRRSGRVLERAAAAEDAGAALAATSRAEEAARLLDEAVELYDGLQAHRDVARAKAVLRKLGIRHGQRGTRGRPSTGWASLTETESRVVALAAEGLSNPQIGACLFISPRTVQTHMAHVFVKLGLRTRSQLAAAFALQS